MCFLFPLKIKFKKQVLLFLLINLIFNFTFGNIEEDFLKTEMNDNFCNIEGYLHSEIMLNHMTAKYISEANKDFTLFENKLISLVNLKRTYSNRNCSNQNESTVVGTEKSVLDSTNNIYQGCSSYYQKVKNRIEIETNLKIELQEFDKNLSLNKQFCPSNKTECINSIKQMKSSEEKMSKWVNELNSALSNEITSDNLTVINEYSLNKIFETNLGDYTDYIFTPLKYFIKLKGELWNSTYNENTTPFTYELNLSKNNIIITTTTTEDIYCSESRMYILKAMLFNWSDLSNSKSISLILMGGVLSPNSNSSDIKEISP